MIVAFSGLDGSGKSTQIKFVEQYFLEKNCTPYVIWGRGGYTVGMESLKSLIRFFNFNGVPNEKGNSAARDEYFGNSYKRKVWLFLAITDLIIIYCLKLRLKKILGIPVICDRHLFDTAVDFELNFPQENVKNWLIWKILVRTALHPTHHFIFTISVDESLRRSELKKEPFPDTREILTERLSKYLELCDKNSKVVHVDCSNSIDSIREIILMRIGK